MDFHFHNISLPAAMNDSIGAQGHVTFTVALRDNLPMGTPIDNWADIVFDTQLPVRTDTTFNTLFAQPAPIVDLGSDLELIVSDSCFLLTPNVAGGSGSYNYEWTNGHTADTLTVCPTDSTWFGLYVTDPATGCKDFDRININVDCNTVGMEDLIENLADVTVFPNPFSGSTHFRIEAQESEEIILEVYNTLGHKVADVFQRRIVPGQALEVDFDAHDLAGGIYFYNLSHQSGNTQSGRMVIMK